MTPQAPVTVAVVSWNTRELLLRCLRSLEPDVEAGRAQVWVVDNGSSDESPAAGRREAPWAEIVEADENLGFGRAVNLVARRTEGEWLVAANADVAVEGGALETLLAQGVTPDTGCVAPRLVLPSGETQHSVYPFPTVPFALAFNVGLQHLSPGFGDRYCLEGHWNADRRRRVPWAIGAFLLLRRSAFESVGGFDERRWMYAEDLDLGWRLRRQGWVTRYEPAAVVKHDASAATTVAFGDRTLERYMAATYETLMRTRGPARTWATAGLNTIGAALRLAIAAPLASTSAARRYRRDSAKRWVRAHARGLAMRPSAARRR